MPRWRAFSTPKGGHGPEEYEDAFAGKGGRFAVADGASESSFARRWAELLVEGFVGSADDEVTPGWLAPLRRRWAAEVDALELDWFAEEKRALGAFATFLGLILRKQARGQEGRWQALAVGDSCLFQVRRGRLVGSFPVRRSADFCIRPALLGSRGAAGRSASGQVVSQAGRWEAGDRFFLITDALAEWFLRNHEGGHKPWQTLARLLAGTDGELTRFVEQLRSQKEIKNDDVTLLMVVLKP
jgi:hypothetical protein